MTVGVDVPSGWVAITPALCSDVELFSVMGKKMALRTVPGRSFPVLGRVDVGVGVATGVVPDVGVAMGVVPNVGVAVALAGAVGVGWVGVAVGVIGSSCDGLSMIFFVPLGRDTKNSPLTCIGWGLKPVITSM
ncbi:hypothetical protein KFU94_50780 [Chloroflexi bacterium TSY]|nr:hypothetical protein [Chloroflexi bacterium TSY]